MITSRLTLDPIAQKAKPRNFIRADIVKMFFKMSANQRRLIRLPQLCFSCWKTDDYTFAWVSNIWTPSPYTIFIVYGRSNVRAKSLQNAAMVITLDSNRRYPQAKVEGTKSHKTDFRLDFRLCRLIRRSSEK